MKPPHCRFRKRAFQVEEGYWAGGERGRRTGESGVRETSGSAGRARPAPRSTQPWTCFLRVKGDISLYIFLGMRGWPLLRTAVRVLLTTPPAVLSGTEGCKDKAGLGCWGLLLPRWESLSEGIHNEVLPWASQEHRPVSSSGWFNGLRWPEVACTKLRSGLHGTHGKGGHAVLLTQVLSPGGVLSTT